jgi:hypothetical protein
MLSFSRRRFIWCPPTSLCCWGSLTELLRRYALTHHRFIRCWRPCGQIIFLRFHATIGWTAAHPSVHPVLLHESWRVYVLFKLDHRIHWWFLPMDHRFIRHYCLLFFFSATRLTLLENGSSVHTTVPWFSPSVPTRPTIAPTLAI